MLAYQIGVEVECKIAEAIEPRHYQHGFHSHRDLRHDRAPRRPARSCWASIARATARALSIAASQAAGLRENFGTMTKPFHAGRARRAASSPRRSPRYGWTATDQILEAPRGFFRAAGGGYDREMPSTASSASRGPSPRPASRSSRIRRAR